jgi:hypothetical protein
MLPIYPDPDLLYSFILLTPEYRIFRLHDPLAPEHDPDSLEKDLDIDQEAPVLQIGAIQLDYLVEVRNLVPARYLP